MMIAKIATLALCLSVSGCSFYGMTRPTSVPEVVIGRVQDDNNCTSSVGAPAADAFITIGATALTGLAVYNAQNATVQSTGNFAQDQQTINQTNDRNWGLVTGVGAITAIYGASAIYGFITADQCSDVKHKAERAEAVARQQEEIRRQQLAEQARQEAIRKQEQDRQDAIRAERDERARRDEQFRHEKEQGQSCAISLSHRKDSKVKLDWHNKVQQWIDANCKDVPAYETQQYIDYSGHVLSRTIQVGTRYVCPSGNSRPRKLDKSAISDVDIKMHNLATNNDDEDAWQRDVEVTQTVCEKFDKEGML